jgi:serine/threonine-protein kinase
VGTPSLLRVSSLEEPLERWLGDRLVLAIRGHDSGCTSYRVRDGGGDLFVKAAYGDDVGQLHGAVAFHASVRHPVIAPLVHAVALPDGLAVVYPWLPGEVLNDPFAPGGLPRDHPASALSRLRARPAAHVARVVSDVLDAHVAIEAAGWVAVDFYDGCVLHDLGTARTTLVDLDLYHRGPYMLDRERQYGSTRFMAPEEWRRGARVGTRTTVFTLGRTARVLLGEPGRWRGSTEQEAVVDRATRPDPADRWPSVAALAQAWHAAG